jgi:hypothetical protein
MVAVGGRVVAVGGTAVAGANVGGTAVGGAAVGAGGAAVAARAGLAVGAGLGAQALSAALLADTASRPLRNTRRFIDRDIASILPHSDNAPSAGWRPWRMETMIL